MKPSAEIEAQGTKAYEQACAFERLRAWRLPVTYSVFPLLPLLIAFALMAKGYEVMAALQFVVAIFFAVWMKLRWRRLTMRYMENLELLAKLKKEYGDQLPWIQMENHFAELEELKREMEEDRRVGGR